MGYGGVDAAMDQGRGRSGDSGIDGTVSDDALGLDEVPVWAKKYAAGDTAGEGELRKQQREGGRTCRATRPR